MGLMNLLGIPERDMFDGLSLPAWLNKKKIGQRPVVSEADAFLEQAVKEQQAQNEADRIAMLAKVRSRMDALDDEPNGDRRRKLIDKWSEAEILLERRISDD